MTEYRAELDAEVTFSNGGRLSAEGFRVDLPGPGTTEREIGELFVASLGLLMTERVHLARVRVFPEAHKGTRNGPGGTSRSAGLEEERQWRLVELSHLIEAGMTTYPGLPGPEVTPHLTREASRSFYAPGTEFAIDRVSMVGNTGTYLDSPYHRYPDGADLAELPLGSLADLPCVVVRTIGSAARAISVGALAGLDVASCAVLLHTGGDEHWGTPRYGEDAQYLTEDGARRLVEHGVRLVGIDAVNIDDTTTRARPAHSVLLGARVPVVEHLTGLGQLPPTGARFSPAPPRFAAFGTFPVRAYAAVPAPGGSPAATATSD
ncbi:MAG: cyclase family protein [Acidimicrobiales bacterium]|jgi:kynurenine formamidase